MINNSGKSDNFVKPTAYKRNYNQMIKSKNGDKNNNRDLQVIETTLFIKREKNDNSSKIQELNLSKSGNKSDEKGKLFKPTHNLNRTPPRELDIKFSQSSKKIKDNDDNIPKIDHEQKENESSINDNTKIKFKDIESNICSTAELIKTKKRRAKTIKKSDIRYFLRNTDKDNSKKMKELKDKSEKLDKLQETIDKINQGKKSKDKIKIDQLINTNRLDLLGLMMEQNSKLDEISEVLKHEQTDNQNEGDENNNDNHNGNEETNKNVEENNEQNTDVRPNDIGLRIDWNNITIGEFKEINPINGKTKLSVVKGFDYDLFSSNEHILYPLWKYDVNHYIGNVYFKRHPFLMLQKRMNDKSKQEPDDDELMRSLILSERNNPFNRTLSCYFYRFFGYCSPSSLIDFCEKYVKKFSKVAIALLFKNSSTKERVDNFNLFIRFPNGTYISQNAFAGFDIGRIDYINLDDEEIFEIVHSKTVYLWHYDPKGRLECYEERGETVYKKNKNRKKDAEVAVENEEQSDE